MKNDFEAEDLLAEMLRVFDDWPNHPFHKHWATIENLDKAATKLLQDKGWTLMRDWNARRQEEILWILPPVKKSKKKKKA